MSFLNGCKFYNVLLTKKLKIVLIEKYDVSHKILNELANLESRHILFAIMKYSKSVKAISTNSNIFRYVNRFFKRVVGWQRVPQGCPSSQIEKKPIQTTSKTQMEKKSNKTVSKQSNRKEINWDNFKTIQIEKKSVKTKSGHPNRVIR